jgi:uncharacterized protein (DUF1330 family)
MSTTMTDNKISENNVVEKTKVNLKKSSQSEKSSSIYMLNVVWFKPYNGEVLYRKYMKVVGPIIKRVGGRKLKSFVPDRPLIGEFDADLLFFVEYPDWQAFKDFANSPEYHKVAYLKEEALEKSLLIRCGRPERSFWS